MTWKGLGDLDCFCTQSHPRYNQIVIQDCHLPLLNFGYQFVNIFEHATKTTHFDPVSPLLQYIDGIYPLKGSFSGCNQPCSDLCDFSIARLFNPPCIPPPPALDQNCHLKRSFAGCSSTTLLPLHYGWIRKTLKKKCKSLQNYTFVSHLEMYQTYVADANIQKTLLILVPCPLLLFIALLLSEKILVTVLRSLSLWTCTSTCAGKVVG